MASCPRPFTDADPAPRLFAVPPGSDYARCLADGLAARLGDQPPEAMAGVTIIVNSARARASIESAFAGRAAGTACYLPQIVTLQTLAAAAPPSLGANGAVHLAQPVPALTRMLSLMRLVEAYCDRTGMARGAAAGLARSLTDLMDLLDEEGCDIDELRAAGADDMPDPAAMARHWERALDFLDIARSAWPAMRAGMATGGVTLDDPRAAERASIEALIAGWKARPPEGAVLVAGSTGSRAIAALVMAAVARLPQGGVVLPGFDIGAASEVWTAVGEGTGDHPAGPFHRLLTALDAGPASVRHWHEGPAETILAPRRLLIAEALRPAPVTDAWVARRAEIATVAGAATAGLTLIEAAEHRDEALAIALAVREALAIPGRHIAIVTPDATLARRVTAALQRFDILPDDSLGRPLAQAPAGVFLRLVLAVARAAAEGRVDAVALAGLLGHPLTRAGWPRARHRRHARKFEIDVLRRRGAATPGPGGALPDWGDDGREKDHVAWSAAVDRALAPLVRSIAACADLAAVLQALMATAEALAAPADAEASATPDRPPWSGPDGTAAHRVLTAMRDAAPAYGAAMAPAALAALLDAELSAESLPPEAARPHPRVSLRGTIEARHETADLTILAGLVEGRWPATADPGPWLNRPMRRALGLPAPEREIGLAAHDFVQGACRAEVILTRSAAIEGRPMVASRWLTRLETLLRGTRPEALAAMRARGRRLLDLADALDTPGPDAATDPHLTPAARPAPRPPVAQRPRRLSVTRLERLVRDPYAVYAESVLGLKPVDPLAAGPDARDRGEIMHRTLERFVATGGERQGEAAEAALMAALDTVLEEEALPPDLQRLWRGRLARVAGRLAALQHRIAGRGDWVGLEVKGAMTLDAPAGSMTLSARADRIDRAPDGTSLVYDYKSGRVPSKKQIGRFAHQLHVQALIAAAGGFEGIAAMPPGSGAYIDLSRATEVGPDDGFADQLSEYRAELAAFIARFDDPGTPYVSRRMVEKKQLDGPYDHLARVAEWADETGEDAG
ncbi:MAG: double-strand break repair protein AddB [Pseudomonadota bacterium]